MSASASEVGYAIKLVLSRLQKIDVAFDFKLKATDFSFNQRIKGVFTRVTSDEERETELVVLKSK